MPSVGNPDVFAVEFGVTTPLENSNQLALGYFVYWVAGNVYGVREDDATLLAASYHAIADRLSRSGRHESRLSNLPKDVLISAYLGQIYGVTGGSRVAIEETDFEGEVRAKELIMAPDGDAAFDDGSHILQFDKGGMVRIVAFKNRGALDKIIADSIELSLNSDTFYDILDGTLSEFDREISARHIPN